MLRRTPFLVVPEHVRDKWMGNPQTGTMTTSTNTIRYSLDNKWIILDCATYYDEEGIKQRPQLQQDFDNLQPAVPYTAYTNRAIDLVIHGENWQSNIIPGD
jgi:hypothetical protein